ncbi:MAG: helix-turn-helix transcriptional regulator [Bacteroidaceae bacterium]|nr:helix-turn-helix transcriptional regulator [Bacteroidaceae bacterium]
MEHRKYNRIKVALAEKGKTGIWLGEQIGKSNTTVSKYINQRVQPDIITVNAIANVLDVDVKDLLVSNRESQI